MSPFLKIRLSVILMNDALGQVLGRARSNRKSNRKYLAQLGRSRDIDDLFHEAHEQVFASVDCLSCANCCKTTSPIFRDIDISRISSHLGIRPSAFTDRYLHLDEDGDWVLNVSPCAFLGEDNHCSIYSVRPRACREYPHTDRKNMAQIMDLTYRNTLVCPAVGLILERIRERQEGV